jgi:Domain of unknown function (DUF5925)/ATPase family associated with various cellular activities (AAA)
VAERREIVSLTDHFDVHSPTGGLLIARALEENRRFIRSENWATTAETLENCGEVVLHATEQGRTSALLMLDGVLVHAVLAGGRVWLSLAAVEDTEIDAALGLLRARLPLPDPSSAHEVTVTFWTYTPHGPQPSWRTISVPEWSEIQENYSASSRAGLEALMDGFKPAHGGQLVLWHGAAGTGKTFALRALAWEWRRWCDLHYIVDPDSFFGEHADYLMNVLLQPSMREGWMSHGPMGAESFSIVAGGGDDDEPEEREWRLLVLEDTGELLTPDAKAVIGQGLSRFLNVVDGLIGQGLRVLVLVTTNEPIRKLHPAVARPGRCAANVEFVPLERDEAKLWLTTRGIEHDPESAEILASLYSRLEGREAVEEAQAAGFAGDVQ